jgi:Fe-S cluster assembly iron-binding protein IscA
MLKVTSEAAYVLKAAREGVTTPTAGLRIKRSDNPNDPWDGFKIGFQQDPDATDQVFEQDGLRVFVAVEVADELSDRTLDVDATSHGAELVFR